MKELKFNEEMKPKCLDGSKTQTRRPFLINGNPITHPDERIEKFNDGAFHYISVGGMSGPYKCPYGEIGTVFHVDGVAYEITSVRVERLQEITEADAQREGWFFEGFDVSKSYDPVTMNSARIWFQKLWDSIYSEKYPWNSNPWVWVIEFKKVEVRE